MPSPSKKLLIKKKLATNNMALSLEKVADINYRKMEHLVYEFAVRWSYALPSWPPKDFDYGAKLKENNLRKVEFARFKAEAELDGDNLKKVYEVEHFEGRYRDSAGVTYDLRPMETCPSLSNFSNMIKDDLQRLLLKAYEAQLKHLFELSQASDHYDRIYEVDLVRQL